MVVDFKVDFKALGMCNAGKAVLRKPDRFLQQFQSGKTESDIFFKFQGNFVHFSWFCNLYVFFLMDLVLCKCYHFLLLPVLHMIAGLPVRSVAPERHIPLLSISLSVSSSPHLTSFNQQSHILYTSNNSSISFPYLCLESATTVTTNGSQEKGVEAISLLKALAWDSGKCAMEVGYPLKPSGSDGSLFPNLSVGNLHMLWRWQLRKRGTEHPHSNLTLGVRNVELTLGGTLVQWKQSERKLFKVRFVQMAEPQGECTNCSH